MEPGYNPFQHVAEFLYGDSRLDYVVILVAGITNINHEWPLQDYQVYDYFEGDLVKLNILVNSETVDAFSNIVHKTRAETIGRRICNKLKDLIPRQNFQIPIQAAIYGKIIARETIKAFRKDVTAKLYGGDVSRKKKLLEKQKKGKKRMKQFGNVEIPQTAFFEALKIGDND